jgi:pyruvate/2-oxoacid:ferredoxin oxidoreductase beta subunit
VSNIFKVPQPKPVLEYVKLQSRFKHLLKDEVGLKSLQAVADKNLEYYGLIQKTDNR